MESQLLEMSDFDKVYSPFEKEFRVFLETGENKNSLSLKISTHPDDLRDRSIRAALKGDMPECMHLYSFQSVKISLWNNPELEDLPVELKEEAIYRTPEFSQKINALRRDIGLPPLSKYFYA